MTRLYGTLSPLAQPVPTDLGEHAESINIYRLTFGQFANIIGETRSSARLAAVVASCKAVTANGIETSFKAKDLDAADGAELIGAISDMLDTEDFESEGDGVSHPMVYQMRYPVQFGDAKIATFEFAAKRIGDIVSFMDSKGDAAEFREFMRNFATIVGAPLPITDSLVDAFDVFDYAMIKEHIMGKLTASRRRLKKAS